MQKQSPRVHMQRPAPPEKLAPDLTPLLRIATLAQQIAARYVSGRHGLMIENASREVLYLYDELPEEIRMLL